MWKGMERYGSAAVCLRSLVPSCPLLTKCDNIRPVSGRLMNSCRRTSLCDVMAFNVSEKRPSNNALGKLLQVAAIISTVCFTV